MKLVNFFFFFQKYAKSLSNKGYTEVLQKVCFLCDLQCNLLFTQQEKTCSKLKKQFINLLIVVPDIFKVNEKDTKVMSAGYSSLKMKTPELPP